MKIILVNYRYFISGGPERYMFNVKEALEQRGHEVIPFSIKTSRNVESKYAKYFAENIGKSDAVFVHEYPKTLRTYCDLVSREFYSFGVKHKLKRLIADTKPDVCYLLAYKRALSPSVIDACYEMGVPVINRISDYNTVCGACSLYHNGRFCTKCFEDNDRSCVSNRCLKGSMVFSLMRYLSIRFFRLKDFDKKIASYVCTNGFMEEVMLKRGYSAGKLNVIPTFFRENGETKQVDKTNVVKGKVKFLYIGNIDESKGIYDLIDALEKLRYKTDAFHLSIVGGLHKSENGKVLALLKDKGIDDYVSFCPFRNDGKVFEYYLDSNVTILPARWPENLPNTLIESLYFNRPVVVPHWGSFKYTTNEDVAFYYKPLSSESLAETLYKIISNQESIQEKVQACDKFFKVNFEEKQHINRLLSLFDAEIGKQ